jgi:H+/Cl- antiporter ClcA
MRLRERFSNIWHAWLESLRLHLSRPDALLQLAVMGLLSGILAGSVIVLFRFLVEGFQELMLPGTGAENYEALPGWARLALPVGGGLLLGIIFRFWADGLYVLGIASVMERLAYHQGYLTLRGFFLQFWGAAIAIVSGHSVGREGPHVYLGAAAASLFGQRLSLPNNTIRTMVGCGAAAGIAASFNTPLAGVIFALEVLMLEYTLASFMPIILATVSATALSNAAMGTAPAFQVHALQIGSLTELPVVILVGLVAGAASAAFVRLLRLFASHSRSIPFWWRTVLAGIIVGLLGWQVPQVLGIGYDTVQDALNGDIALGLVLILALAKIVATSASVGLGVPGGMIGPALFIGATLGSSIGIAADQLVTGGLGSASGFYALLGMGGMMAAAMHAPLAGLTAMMELTYNPGIIMPGMLVVTVASLTASELFRTESLFITMLKASGLDYNTDPVLQALRRVGVGSIMSRSFKRLDHLVEPDKADEVLQGQPEWLILTHDRQPVALMWAIEFARYLQETRESGQTHDQPIDLLEIPATHRFEITGIQLEATLQEALDRMRETAAEALFVERVTAPGIKRIYGVLTREMLESSYRY